jgi:mono/diheme cytochrome c family protein
VDPVGPHHGGAGTPSSAGSIGSSSRSDKGHDEATFPVASSPRLGRKNVRAKVAAVLLLVVLARPATAQQQEGDPAAGRELASQLCAACHIVGSERVGSDVAPPFAAIAKDPGVTLTELHAWIGPAHPMLPDLALTPEQIADINAYLDTLRGAEVQETPRGATEAPPPALEDAPAERLGDPIERSD